MKTRKKIFASVLILSMVLSIMPLASIPSGAISTAVADGSYMSIADSSFAIKRDGTLWAWGGNYYGILGDGTRVNRNIPVKVLDDVVAVYRSWNRTMAIKSDNTLWAWGNNRARYESGSWIWESINRTRYYSFSSTTDFYGLLGIDSRTEIYTTPTKIMDNVKAVSMSEHQTYVIKTDGTLWGWGVGFYYTNYNIFSSTPPSRVSALGDGTTHDRVTPTKLMDNVSAISVTHSGAYSIGTHSGTHVIKTDGSLWAWGWNESGQLGDGTTQNRETPVKIENNVSAIYYGGGLIKTDGSLWELDSTKNQFIKRVERDVVMVTQTLVMGDSQGPLLRNLPGSEDIFWWRPLSYLKSDGSYYLLGWNNQPDQLFLSNVASVSGQLALMKDGTLMTWNNSYPGDGTIRDDERNWRNELIRVPIDNIRMPDDVHVRFNSLGGTPVNSVCVPNNGTIAPPVSPKKDDSEFAGWYRDEALTQPWNFTTDRVTENITLYAKWDTTKVSVNFISNATAEFPPVEVSQGALIEPPQIPTRAGYSFAGWYKNEALTIPWNFTNDKATGTIVNLYGKWNALPGSGSVRASPTGSKVIVNGKAIEFEAYLIGGNNYFKLRDIAFELNGTNRQFNVEWDAFYNAISITSGRRYVSVGGELARSGNTAAKTVSATTSTIYLNGQIIFMPAYLIDGNNYFRLRDLAVAMNFGVGWDASTNTITITSSENYTAE